MDDKSMKASTSDDGGTEKENGENNASHRVNILSAVGYIFLVAFWSYYTSFPGLISSSGIEPVARLMPFASPVLHQTLIATNRIDADSLCELSAVLGIVLSCIVASGWIQHGLVFVIMTGLYSVLTRAGGTFYSFQWDTLLLEVGTLTALCYAPWNQLRPTDSCPLGAWTLRFLLFKLMYMSGVVKIQADCPTWRNLTALEYHFATQCLPGPLAWHFHQLHPFLLRFSVATTLWIEIPGAFLLLLTLFPTIVRIGVVLQILLQAVITLTGNYNFFNLLTIVLSLACLKPNAPEQSRKRIAVERIATWIFFIWSFSRMFVIRMVPLQHWWRHLSISLKMSKADCDAFSETVLPYVIVACLLFVLWQGMSSYRRNKNPLTLIHAFGCTVAMGVTALPLCSLTRSLQQDELWGVKQLFVPIYRSVLPYRLVNGYGLFRRMTGVGPLSGSGWAGQPPSVVERPEIVLEGLFEGDDEQWTELSFRWKPGDEYAIPQQVAPHQPRLDWQMWFAALGTPQRNAWFLNLIVKLLDDCTVVQHLVGDSKLDDKLVKIRAKLYHYDFSRLNTEWNRRIPQTLLTNTTNILQRPHQYWYRTFTRPYLGEMDKNVYTDLRNQLAANGYTQMCHYGTEHQCGQAPNKWCHTAFFIRKHSLHLVPILTLLGALTYKAMKGENRLKRGSEMVQPVVSEEKKNQ